MATWTENIDTPVVPSGIAVSKNIGFQAHSVIIDNFTTYWLYLKDADVYVPPYWIGVIRNLLHATDYAIAEWKSPFTTTQTPAGIESFFAHFVWVSDVLPPAGGSLLDGFTFNDSGVLIGSSFVNLPDTSVLAVPTLSPIVIPTTPLANRRALMIQAAESNTDYIYVGGPNVSTSRVAGSFGGVSLAPQQTYPVDTNGAPLYVIANIAGQIVIVQEGA